MGDTIRLLCTNLGVDWAKFIAQTLNFGIVLFVLWKFAYKPVLTMLAVRRDKIAESLSNAEKVKAELARTEEERKRVLTEAGALASKIIEETRQQAEVELARRTQEAAATANQIIVKARQANEADLARMKAELRKEMGRLVAETTAKVTGKILSVEDHQRLAEETTKELAA
jgi:F-type H+-transporting ATPase subunit b